MEQVTREIKIREENGDIYSEVFDEAIEDTKMEMMKLIFAVASALGLDPKDLSDHYNNESVKEYAEQVLLELEK